MPYAREDPSVTLPVKKGDGIEISLPRHVKEGEYISSWWGALIGKDIFAWIESGLDDDQGCAIVRVTLYASSSFRVEHGIELALGHESLLARPLRVAEAAAVKWAKEVSCDGEAQVLTRIEVKCVKEFLLSSASLWVILPEFFIEKCFGGQARIVAAADAALKTREWGNGCYTCELVYGLYLDLRFSPPSQWLRSMTNVVDAYASSHDPDEGVGDLDEIRVAVLEGAVRMEGVAIQAEEMAGVEIRAEEMVGVAIQAEEMAGVARRAEEMAGVAIRVVEMVDAAIEAVGMTGKAPKVAAGASETISGAQGRKGLDGAG
ncbi:hypothetical protein CBR_g22164 [Chara braunii]|uniref:Uncharacterized protein n=1 Tax=Chara braunii TaxID=69332 RepID=A0A388L2A2_CHABU|nr:hypothetical protein CBR_g22164 [Chara braunii]|eukprot:GBG76416.1 hypothetical protein CBR_g22164 [Chara braunii]